MNDKNANTNNSAFVLRLEKEIGKYVKVLNEARVTILDTEISKYPIFVFSDVPIELGVILKERQEPEYPWYVYASTLENFATSGVVVADKIQDFIATYRERADDYCIFSIYRGQHNFVFIKQNIHLASDN